MKKRRKHDSSFKAKIALEALANDRTVNEIAAKYQVLPAQISQWKRELINRANSIYEEGKKSASIDDRDKEVSELHQKIGQLTVEIDWLKKKLNH
jgi:transposase-like protein